MRRAAYWFPPDADDLDKSFAMLDETERDLDRAVKEFGKVAKYVSEFNTTGSDRARDELLDLITRYNRELLDIKKQVKRMADAKSRFAGLVLKAFHSPGDQDDKAHAPDGFDGAPAFAFSASTYRYERR